jgi:hypothetical protein
MTSKTSNDPFKDFKTTSISQSSFIADSNGLQFVEGEVAMFSFSQHV